MQKKSSSGNKRSVKSVQAKMASSRPMTFRMHVLAKKSGWALKREGTKRASKVFSNKAEAVDSATRLLKNKTVRNVIIHKGDGSIDRWKSKTTRMKK